MKTIEDYLNNFSISKGYKSLGQMLCTNPIEIESYIKEAVKQYASQMCDEQIQACAENASIKQESEYIDSLTGYAIVSRIDEDSILNTPNVVTICE